MNKQAFLIMYHNDYYILERLLKQIDSKNFDIYLHVDKKVKNFDFEYTKKILKKSKIYFVKRINVKWSAYSQIKCELILLNEATKKHYSYYHLISGVDLLLKSSDDIYQFFKKNKGKEFVAYQNIDNVTEDQKDRIKYYHIFNGNRRHKNKIIRELSIKIYYKLLSIQKKLKINRLKNNQLEIRKGANWFSITDDLANYLLTKREEIAKTYKFTNCADEIFLQTITYNSKFKNKIYNEYSDEHQNIKRYIDWNRGQPYVFSINDYEELINSECFFARKFSSQKDKDIIDKIYTTLKGKKMIKVSIIVPVYNTSKYLDKCITSLINQTLKDIEIIIVNDGSIDDSQKKIELWQKKDKRIKLYNKENGGQASARNLGLSVAKGEYIAFLDSDDYVADEMYYLLYQEAKNNDFDIVLCDYYLDYGNKILKSNQLSTKTSIMSANDYILSTPSPVNKLIKRTFLKENNFSFPEGFIYEDLAAMPILGIYNPTIKYINKYLYYYVQTPVSTMRNDEYKEKYEDIFKAIEYLYNNMIDKDYNQELEYLLTYHFLYLGSLNFFKYKKYENINKISKIMHECFPYWSKNKFVTSKLTKKQILYMKLFYYKKYFLINFYRRLLTKNEQN